MDFDYNEQVRAHARTALAKAKERENYIEINVFIATLEKFEDYSEQIDELIALRTTIRNDKSARGQKVARFATRFFKKIS
ncbi:hypothetical protein LA080_006594 [Diaporthe eres]|nr:hypothetical protein LA080_006594 [Diaporthe eres]